MHTNTIFPGRPVGLGVASPGTFLRNGCSPLKNTAPVPGCPPSERDLAVTLRVAPLHPCTVVQIPTEKATLIHCIFGPKRKAKLL